MKLTPFLLVAASPIFAAPSLDQRVSTLEKQMNEVRVPSVYGNAGAKTASATAATNRYGPVFSIEMLYCKPFFGGNEFGFTDTVFPVASPYIGHIVQFNFDWQFGLRAGFGYQFCNPDWLLSTEFTHLKIEQTKHVSKPLMASGLPNVANETSAEGSWHLSYNVLDFDLGRAYFMRPRLSLHPKIGVRTAWIKQRDHEQYFNASNSVNNLLTNVNSTSGAGLLGGTGLQWHFSSQWSLFSNFIASLIYGKIEVGAKIINYRTTPVEPLKVSADTYKVLPNMSLDAGLRWETAWKVVHFALSAGYEFQYWWRQNQRVHLEGGTTYSWVRHAEDLGFHGFKLNAMLDF
jgi:hypothetical protein